ncbi:MAG: fibronectin type III domain-containing protein [Chthonomonas sp.]|nr:fibronectin type III domain-containing protein [Chthonomonas sp.]
MSTYITNERNETRFAEDCSTFHAGAVKHDEILLITAPELASMAAIFTALNTALGNASDAKAAYAASVVAKNAALDAAHAEVGRWAKIWRANQDVPDEVLAELLLPAHNPGRTSTPPTQPLEMTFNATSQGSIMLKWKRNGNIPGTIFQIERSPNGATIWTNIGSTTKAKFNTVSQPGVPVYYRVTAVRDNLTSAPSDPITIWPGEEETTLLQAA